MKIHFGETADVENDSDTSYLDYHFEAYCQAATVAPSSPEALL